METFSPVNDTIASQALTGSTDRKRLGIQGEEGVMTSSCSVASITPRTLRLSLSLSLSLCACVCARVRARVCVQKVLIPERQHVVYV